MPDSKFYRAQTARARCEAGQFVLMGRTLRVFSLAHYALLDELIGDSLWEAEPDSPTLDIISRICAVRRPGDEIADVSTPAQRERYGHSLMQFDLATEHAVWAAYMHLCFLSRPRTRHATAGKSLELRAPFALLLSTYILRHVHGIPRDELWHDWPVAAVFWEYESAREQIGEVSYFADSDEPDAEPTPEEIAAEEKHATLAKKIMDDFLPRIALAENEPAASALVAEQTRLLGLASIGALGDDLSELPAPL